MRLLKPLLKFLIPVAISFVLFITVDGLAAIGFILLYILYMAFKNRAGIYSFIGRLRYAKGSISDAIVWYGRAYRSGKAAPKLVISYAYLLLKAGNNEEAEKILNNIVKTKLKDDEMMIARANIALVEWKKGNLDEAIRMQEEISATFKNSTLYGSLGFLLILKGDLDRALEYNLEAYDYNSSNAVIADNLGQTYYLRGEYFKAIEVYEKLMPANPTFPEAYYNYSLVLRARNELDKALEMAKKARNYEISNLSGVTKQQLEDNISEITAAIDSDKKGE